VALVFDLTLIDRHFADFICRESGKNSFCLRVTVSLLSSVVGNGHICLNLPAIAGREILLDGKNYVIPVLYELLCELDGLPTVGPPGAFRPLVLDNAGRLYLYRYWKYENDLVRIILEKSSHSCTIPDRELLARGLDRLFPSGAGDGPDWQKIAALAAVRKRFCVISGGPGTGKTSTVVKIIALLMEQSGGEHHRIALAAPTGKSAARLRESIRIMKEKLDCPDSVRERIPHEVSTIHRLLGSFGKTTRFRHSAENPLPCDTIIIDEASMVALPLMARLALALKPDARLIILGDRDQLASVEAGAVLGDICGTAGIPFSPDFSVLSSNLAHAIITPHHSAPRVPPLTDALVVLKKNYRFGAASGIGQVAEAVNAGDGTAALALLKSAKADISWCELPQSGVLKIRLADQVIARYGAYLAAATPEEALVRFDEFRILCALRRSPAGVEGVNQLVEDILAGAGLIDPSSRWYRGRPVLVTVNDYNLKLFNGDIGIVFPDPEADDAPRVYFPSPDGGVRKISPVRLPAHETVYAMTVHKSQGSEFERILLLLPAHDSELLSRELVYTAITRAKNGAAIWGTGEIFIAAVARRIERSSGLRDALWAAHDDDSECMLTE
jgi:exodeoxyribonuclease V alpha subunit